MRLEFDECEKCEKSRDIYNCIDICHKPLDALKEFNSYKRLEKRGRLLKLPCEIGHMAYEIYQFCGIGAWEIEEHKIRLEDLENIGKTIFLTRQAAENARTEKESLRQCHFEGLSDKAELQLYASVGTVLEKSAERTPLP